MGNRKEKQPRPLLLTLSIFGSIALLGAGIQDAQAKCSIRSADALVASRYEGCKHRSLISYLHNNLITPYSFSCGKKILNECKTSGCAKPKNTEERERCEREYMAVLESCADELEGAARMAQCKEKREWRVMHAQGEADQAPQTLPNPTRAEPVIAESSMTKPAMAKSTLAEPTIAESTQAEPNSPPLRPSTPVLTASAPRLKRSQKRAPASTGASVKTPPAAAVITFPGRAEPRILDRAQAPVFRQGVPPLELR